MPLLPGKTAQESMMAYLQLGPQEYTKLALQQTAPTDLQRNAAAMGLQPGTPEYQNYIKAATVRMQTVAPGGTLYDPAAGQAVFSAPQNGIQTTFGPNGPQSAAVPGYAEANAGIIGAQKAAEARGAATQNIVDVPMGDGTTQRLPQDVAVDRLRQQATGSQATNAGPGGTGFGVTPNPKVQEARTALPQVLANTDQVLKTIDGIEKAPGLPRAVGLPSLLWTRPGSEAADAEAKIDQLQGQVFLQAYQALKGGGQITEIEGKKAENALARLQKNQGLPAFKEALNDFRDVVTTARNRAYQQAGITPPDASGIFAPKSAQEYQALPSGALFRDPEKGTLRRKP
jgi:hypothetical protein